MGAVKTTFIFVVVSVVAHIVLGMCFALLLNTKYFKSRTKTIARVIYVLPWVFTASVIAILWKLMLQPAGIVDYLLSFLNLATKDTEWLSNHYLCQYLVRIPVLHDQHSGRIAGHIGGSV